MASKIIGVSLPESLAWKLNKLSAETGIPKSRLIVKGLLCLISLTSEQEVSLNMIEEEHQKTQEVK